jgi:hypothetical protein
LAILACLIAWRALTSKSSVFIPPPVKLDKLSNLNCFSKLVVIAYTSLGSPSNLVNKCFNTSSNFSAYSFPWFPVPAPEEEIELPN